VSQLRPCHPADGVFRARVSLDSWSREIGWVADEKISGHMAHSTRTSRMHRRPRRSHLTRGIFHGNCHSPRFRVKGNRENYVGLGIVFLGGYGNRQRPGSVFRNGILILCCRHCTYIQTRHHQAQCSYKAIPAAASSPYDSCIQTPAHARCRSPAFLECWALNLCHLVLAESHFTTSPPDYRAMIRCTTLCVAPRYPSSRNP